MDPQRVDDDQEAITAVVGTVLVLAITVAGIAMALFLGVPTVERLQEASAAKAAIGQLAAVDGSLRALTIADSSRVTGISPLQGTMTLGPGSHWMVTATVGTCSFAVQDWSDWDTAGANQVTLVTTNCGTPAPTACAAIPAGDCVDVRRGDGASGVQIVTSASAIQATFSGPLAKNDDYSFTLYDGASRVGYAWLLGSDRLSWQRGNSQAILEAGTVFANEQGGLYLVTGPRVDETPPVLPSTTGNFLLSMPRLTATTTGSFGGDGEHTIYTKLERRNLLVGNMADVAQVRIDSHGDWSEAWCNAFLTRNTLASLSAADYDDVTVGHECGASPSDSIRSVTYNPLASATFTFTLTQSVYAAELQV